MKIRKSFFENKIIFNKIRKIYLIHKSEILSQILLFIVPYKLELRLSIILDTTQTKNALELYLNLISFVDFFSSYLVSVFVLIERIKKACCWKILSGCDFSSLHAGCRDVMNVQ